MMLLTLILSLLVFMTGLPVHAQTVSDALLSDITFDASVPAGQSVAGAQWYLDTQPYGTEQTVPPYTATVNLLSIPAGSHTMTASFRSSTGATVSTQVFGLTSASVITSCSQYTPATVIPTGFASPFDVVSSPSTNLINATCDTSSVRVDLGKGDPLQYIYNTGYLFKTGGTAWNPVPYTSTELLVANAWYPKTANATIAMTSTELANPSYVLGYVCSWTGTSWKCGCRDNACTQSYWQIQSFKK